MAVKEEYDDTAHAPAPAPAPMHTARTSTRAGTARRGKPKAKAGAAAAGKAPASKVLPKGHKPARGRGRTKQLQQMTKAQKQAEDAILRERCRQAARDFRLRRKNKITDLQDALDHFKGLSETQAREITKLKATVAKLRAAQRKPK